ncbi:MAG TPA: ABC transporter substrate-binding protein [Chloroflexota bacterium]|jgi:iron(III) transport system substrate-binding protein
MIWGAGIFGGAAGMSRLTEGFHRHYGLDLEVQFTPGPPSTEVAAKTILEYQAGRPASVDVLLAPADQTVSVLRAGALEPLDWSWAPNVNPRALGGDGVGVEVETLLSGITYNSQRVTADAVPRSLEDLLKPEYKGRVAAPPYAPSFSELAAPEVWGRQRTLDYATRLSEQLGGLIRCNEDERLISGEFDILAPECSHGRVLQAKARGRPLDFVVAADSGITLPFYMSIPKNAAHPNAAKLWINYIAGREAQDLIFEFDNMDAEQADGSKTAAFLKSLEASGVKINRAGMAFYQRNDAEELNATLREVQRIFAKQ